MASFAHAPVSSLGLRDTSAWPNARDVVHQQMNLNSIRRAYEGGLRLMFASTTDDQVIAALLSGPNFDNAFVPDPNADLASARTQLQQIRQMVADSSGWMGIATTSQGARDIINSGRLALVLSLEMDGFQPGEIDGLVTSEGVRQVFPVHLLDNNIGGTAAAGPLFNSASAAVSSIYRSDKLPRQYMNLVATREYPHVLGLPQTLGTAPIPIYVGLEDISYPAYLGLCYEPLSACSGSVPAPTSFIEFGQQNLRGLVSTAQEEDAGMHSGAEQVRSMMASKLIVDISHMGARSAAETVGLDPQYPLIASHGDIAHECSTSTAPAGCVDTSRHPQSERSLDADAAREIVRRQGVLGLGAGANNYDTQALLSVRGAPLVTLEPSHRTACVGAPNATSCEPIPTVDAADPTTPIDTLKIETLGGISGHGPNAQPFVRVELRDPVGFDQYQHRVQVMPMDCSQQSCTATVALGTRNASTPPHDACTSLTCGDEATCTPDAYTVDDIESVTLQWLYLACDGDCQRDAGIGGTDVRELTARQCTSSWDDARAPTWPITSIDVTASSPAGEVSIISLGPRVSRPLVTIDRNAGSFLVFDREDRPSAEKNVRATGHLLRLSVTSGAGTLVGSNPQTIGANLCAALRLKVGGACVAAAHPPLPSANDCPSGWVSMNQRGTWSSGTLLYTFLRYSGSVGSICGVDFALLDPETTQPPFDLTAVKVEQIEDPVGHWVVRYSELSRNVAGSQLGTIAFGTDFNGLNGLTDMSELPLPADAMNPSGCKVSSGDPAPSARRIAPMRFRNSDGTLGSEVRIDERGLATYGHLADMLAIIDRYPGCGRDVHDSLMLSAEATLRAWEAIENGTPSTRAKLPTRSFACGPPPVVAP